MGIEFWKYRLPPATVLCSKVRKSIYCSKKDVFYTLVFHGLSSCHGLYQMCPINMLKQCNKFHSYYEMRQLFMSRNKYTYSSKNLNEVLFLFLRHEGIVFILLVSRCNSSGNRLKISIHKN